VIAISLTIIAIFAPRASCRHRRSVLQAVRHHVSVQVFFSLLAARFVTPVLAAYFLKTVTDDPPPDAC